MKKILTLVALAGLFAGCGRSDQGTIEGGSTGTNQGTSDTNKSGVVVPSINTKTNDTNLNTTTPAPNVGPAPQDTSQPSDTTQPR